MKVIVKTLKQVNHEVEISSDEIKISELKTSIENQHKIEASTIKLVFNGTVLKDESTLKEYNITEGNIIIMMISKTKVQNKPQEVVPTQTEVKKEDPQAKITENKPSSSNTKNYSSEVAQLVEMGFPKEYAESAIKAAKGNISVAIEYLYNGIPDVADLPEASNNDNNESQPHQGSEMDAVKKIASLVKILCANDPSKLQSIIMSLQHSQPELLALIKKHENEFKELISKPITEEDMAAFQEINNQTGLAGNFANSQGTQGGETGQGVIKLNKTEYDAVQRLKEFGFSEMDAAQAYFACDKNEEMALNFLFETKNQEGDYGNYEDFQEQNEGNQNENNPQDKDNNENKDEKKDN